MGRKKSYQKQIFRLKNELRKYEGMRATDSDNLIDEQGRAV